jgi:hypothetical protein
MTLTLLVREPSHPGTGAVRNVWYSRCDAKNIIKYCHAFSMSFSQPSHSSTKCSLSWTEIWKLRPLTIWGSSYWIRGAIYSLVIFQALGSSLQGLSELWKVEFPKRPYRGLPGASYFDRPQPTPSWFIPTHSCRYCKLILAGANISKISAI